MIGTRLSHYLIAEELGAGGMGVVYRARDERLDRDVAVKVLPAGSLDETTRARFRREALALSRLNHPHIGMVHDFGSDQGTDFLVMELVRGRTLRARLREGPLPVEEVADIGIAVADALEEAHEQGVIHRDLKPENVLITAKGWVKVLDFGLAALRAMPGTTVTTETLTVAHTLTGTLPYMAPEQLIGKPAEAQTDIYALGVLLYELATGRRPFEETNQAALIGEILHKKGVAPSSHRAGIPLWFDSVTARCLEKELTARFENAAALKAALKAGVKAGASTATMGAPVTGGSPGGVAVLTPPGSGPATPHGSPLAGTVTPGVSPSSWSPVTPGYGQHAGAGGAVNPEAYSAVLRGQSVIARRTEDGVRRGIEYLQRAIDIDPVYAAGYAALAAAYNIMGYYAMTAPSDCFPRARAAAQRAVELNPAWAQAYTSLGYVALYYEWDFPRAEALFKKAIELDPQYAIGPLWYANLLIFQRRFDEALEMVTRAQNLDPLSSIVSMSKGWVSAYNGDLEGALREYKKTTDFDPEFHVAPWMASWVLTNLGRMDEALQAATRAVEVSKGLLIVYPALARVHALAGRPAEARRVLSDLEAKSPARYIDPVEISMAYEALGERDRALEWLDRGLKERGHWMIALGIDQRFDSMRGDPRFEATAKKVGVPKA